MIQKPLGQVFLTNLSYIEKIKNSLDIDGETVVEIGPGRGAITKHLAARAKKLYAVEADRKLHEQLVIQFVDSENVELLSKNILNFDFSFLKEKAVVFGNIPYCISSDIIKHLVKNRAFVKRAYLTCQKEFIEKLAAKPSTGGYVFLSCYFQYHSRIIKLFDIPANAFSPIPKVNSTFALLDFLEEPDIPANDEGFLFELIKNAFANRRKKIINAIHAEDKKDILASCGIDPSLRPENISLEQYITLANAIKPIP